MARADLSSLLGKLPADNAPALPKPASRKPPAEPDRDPEPAHPAVVEKVEQSASPVPEATYLGFVRKDTRLREDQLEALTVQARRLNRAKRNTGVRITENTLIRIGVDLLLARIDQATGDDEAALLRSLR